MFFNRNKKIADQISIAILNNFRVYFAFSDYLKEGVFTAPEGFYEDEYIVGFIHTCSALHLKADFNSQRMSVTKKGEIVIRIFMNICGENWRDAIQFVKEQSLASNPNSEFLRAQEDAVTLLGAVGGFLNPEDENPIFLQAQKDSFIVDKALEGMSDFMGLENDENTALVTSIMDLTIGKHIKENYL